MKWGDIYGLVDKTIQGMASGIKLAEKIADKITFKVIFGKYVHNEYFFVPEGWTKDQLEEHIRTNRLIPMKIGEYLEANKERIEALTENEQINTVVKATTESIKWTLQEPTIHVTDHVKVEIESPSVEETVRGPHSTGSSKE